MLDETNKYTIEAAVQMVAAQLESAQLEFGHGTDNAWDEACWLVLSAMELSPTEAPDFQRVLTPFDCNSVNRLLVDRVEHRVPLAYLTGSAWFAGLEFKTDSRALVPRSPLAEWILEDFFGFSPVEDPKVLDLCTGGGCIAIATAVHHPHTRVLGSDLSAEAITLAEENARLHQVDGRVQFRTCSLFEGIHERFDLIVSNPPYVDARDISTMPDEYRHEPEIALGAGEDGLDIVSQILDQADQYLTEHGMLVVEVGNSDEALQAAYPELPFLWLEFANGGSGVFALTREQLNSS